MSKQFSMSMYAGRDDMHKAMIEYIRELEAKIEGNEAELQEKLRQQRDKYARIAMHGCLVPPDGGSPTKEEADLCEAISDAILAADLDD